MVPVSDRLQKARWTLGLQARYAGYALGAKQPCYNRRG